MGFSDFFSKFLTVEGDFSFCPWETLNTDIRLSVVASLVFETLLSSQLLCIKAHFWQDRYIFPIAHRKVPKKFLKQCVNKHSETLQLTESSNLFLYTMPQLSLLINVHTFVFFTNFKTIANFLDYTKRKFPTHLNYMFSLLA